jgi:zinc transporter ZupT
MLIEVFFLFLAADSKFLKTLLSFAVGGLLGDVFLHLLPEAWENDMKDKTGEMIE